MILRRLVGTLAVVALLGSCAALGLVNPFVGTWTGEAFDTITYEFDADMTFSYTGLGDTDTGTYAYTDERLTLTYDDSDVVEMLYEFRDGLLILDATGGMSISLVLSPVD